MAELIDKEKLVNAFNTFIAAVHRDDSTGRSRQPYQWQGRLMQRVADDRHWPERIAAPTASGKTCVIDIHVFLNALAGLAQCEEPGFAWVDPGLVSIPRRLVLTVNRRSLVDDQYEEALALCRRIVKEADSCEDEETRKVLRIIRKGLLARSSSYVFPEDPNLEKNGKNYSVLNVVELRGGMGSSGVDRNWRYFPQTCAIVCATPDMFGSRLLFRGYGTSRAMRPMEAGLLAYDTVLIADEAHLSRQLVETARQVARLERFVKSPIPQFVPVLQVVSTTATQTESAEDSTVVGVEASDFEIDKALARRLTSPKPVIPDCTASSRAEILTNITERCFTLIQKMEHADAAKRGIVGCVLNRVSDAVTVGKQLQRRLKDAGIDRPVESYLGPMRGFEKQQVSTKLKKCFGVDAFDDPQTPCCIIGTQTLEVGVDADFSALVTELAPAAAIVQRAGRVNRQGKRPTGHVYIVGLAPDTDKKIQEKEAGPYQLSDLLKCGDWLRTLPLTDSADGSLSEAYNISAWAVLSDSSAPPSETSRRLLRQRLEISDVENLSHTDEDLGADISMEGLQQQPSDINLWLRDGLENDEETNASIVVRHLPVNSDIASMVVEAAPPTALEQFPVRSLTQLFAKKNSLAAYLEESDNGEKSRIPQHRAFLYNAQRDEGNRTVCVTDSDSFKAGFVPGTIVVVDDDVPLFNSQTHVFDPSSEFGDTEVDVLNFTNSAEYVIGLDGSSEVARMVREYSATTMQAEDGASDAESDLNSKDVIAGIIQSAHLHLKPDESSGDKPLRIDSVFSDDEDSMLWIVLSNAETLSQTFQIQEMAVENKTVRLQGPEGHEGHVSLRAKCLAMQVGLSDTFANIEQDAGLYHDEGKKDSRFQTLLRHGRARGESEDYWAKSKFSGRQFEIRYRAEAQLRGWRHEQRSVAEYLAIVFGNPSDDFVELHPESSLRLLSARLVGTSHGHGRSSFAHTEKFLIPDAADAEAAVIAWSKRLFDEGEWETLIQITNETFGFWGSAYLEALLRAADITVSMEGR
ncbi:type I-U CRISPR-associated helicase/endonuclease Cas3 [Bifidobacterium thermophilum]|uniref:type I-G CRISPR-associated helicase/endonuclease Cas3g n=1 Tax=Bifidobacterium thermophilum TaxID=33905 RepID=UPI0039959065